MTRLHRNVNVAAVIVPFVAFLVAVPLLWNSLVGWTDLAILLVLYLLSGFGITVGFHRLLTHRAFETYRPVKYLFAVLGTVAVQGPVIGWVADHRKHHAFTDAEGDPHSPHVGHGGGDGWRGTLRGLWHAHVGWLFEYDSGRDAERYAPDLLEDRGMVWISRNFTWIVVASLLLAFGLGCALLTGTLGGALTALLWGGFVRIFFLHHVTWSINSICHFFGRRRFSTEDRSTNVFWLSLVSFGESWHHHHAFPRSAWHGLRWWELDLGGWLIGAMRRVHLAWNVVRITPERQAQKLAAAAERAGLERVAHQG